MNGCCRRKAGRIWPGCLLKWQRNKERERKEQGEGKKRTRRGKEQGEGKNKERERKEQGEGKKRTRRGKEKNKERERECATQLDGKRVDSVEGESMKIKPANYCGGEYRE